MLQAICSVPPLQVPRLISITRILIQAKTARAVIRAAVEVLKLLHNNNSVKGLQMVAVVTYAARLRADFSDHELLGNLCAKCVLSIMQGANFHLDHAVAWQAKWVIKTLAEIHFTEENSTSILRTVIEFSIETKGFSLPIPTQQTVIGQDMPMSELAQLLQRMDETPLFEEFNLDAAISDIQASRNI
jgi:hypothetical protein